ncbi:hypothetical protein Drorol1_Dr00012277 [Drosera rotundifolia]
MDRRRSHISDIEYAAKITEEAMPPEPLLRVGYVLSTTIPKVKFFQQADLAELGFRDPVKRKMMLDYLGIPLFKLLSLLRIGEVLWIEHRKISVTLTPSSTNNYTKTLRTVFSREMGRRSCLTLN